ncbi:MAG: lactate utilization protein [Proteobacteria bacterium]|nr:lactate utilization protein [Pseudomonadota bacterium]
MPSEIDSFLRTLEKRGYQARFFPVPEEARHYLLSRIEPGSAVGVGGSKTIRDLEVIPEIRIRAGKLYDHWQEGLNLADDQMIRKAQLTCDLFLTSANAITREGEIVNMDGIGNRVAALIFGPQKVMVVVGINKIVADREAAIRRIREVAGPLRAKSLNLPNPCVKAGVCQDCDLPTRICRALVILARAPSRSQIEVIVIGKEMGF